jgi:DNA-binding beta-propeller fold protein YncE
MIHHERRFGTLALLTLAACGGGGGGGTSAVAPSNLVYPRTIAVLITDVSATPDTPTYAGSPSTFSIVPPLPSGLSIDVHTGAISGLPTQASDLTSYVVRASTAAGFTTAMVKLGVSFAPRFAYVLNQTDSTITLFREDVLTGSLNHVGYLLAPASQTGPERIVVHPSGSFAYVPNMASSNLSVYTINPSDGLLTPERGGTRRGSGCP